jgi:serine/threonine-protein kinase
MPVAAVAPIAGADASATTLVPGIPEDQQEPERRSGARNVLITLGVVLVLALAGLAGWALFQPSAEQVRVPNLFGLTLADADRALAERDLTVGETTERPDPDAEAGTVVEQLPTSGELVDPETSVDLVVSTGADTTLVPQVVGLAVADARPLLTEAGLTIEEVREEPSDEQEGTVLQVNPPEGSEVEVGSSVVIVASSGTVEVPNVEGLPEAEATAILTQAGFEVLSTDEESDSAAPGTVLFQAPGAGTEVSVGSRVAITVAVAPAPEPTPEPPPTQQPPASPAPTSDPATTPAP